MKKTTHFLTNCLIGVGEFFDMLLILVIIFIRNVSLPINCELVLKITK